jgi:hypothetical protein
MFSDVFARVESGYSHRHSVVHDPSARGAAISAADKEVDAARKLLRSLLIRRNTLAPIAVLPPEVLARVFHFLARDEPPCLGRQCLGWIRATHVCQLWRQVALGDSSLWARISGVVTNKELVSEMLVRARNAPLDIDIDLGGTPHPDMFLIFAPHLSHTRELRLHSLSIPLSDSIRGIYGREAPALEHFELGVSVASPITFRELGGATLFRGRAPKLRTFSLSQVLIPWSLIPRGQLTQLKIVLFTEVPVADVSKDNLNQLIDLLANSPGLELLVLESCLPSQLGRFPYGRTIQLPLLSRLCLAGSSSRIMNLLKMLKLPPSTMLHLHCISESTPTYNDHQLLPVVASHYQNPHPIEFKTLSVTISNMGTLLDVSASTILPRSKFRKPLELQNDLDSDNEFVLSFDELPELENWKDLLERVCKILPISDIDFFSISATDVVDSVDWVELFKRCPKVTTVQAIGRGTSSLVRALTAPNTNPRPAGGKGKGKKKKRDGRDGIPAQPARSTTSHAPPHTTPLFPKMSFLALRMLDFAENKPSGVLFDVVQKGLQQRKGAGKVPLKTLNIETCNISAKRARVLEKLVQDFHWDCEEGYLDEFEDFDEYDQDFVDPGERWEDFFIGTSQAEWDWWENYSDGW